MAFALLTLSFFSDVERGLQCHDIFTHFFHVIDTFASSHLDVDGDALIRCRYVNHQAAMLHGQHMVVKSDVDVKAFAG